MGKTKEPVKPEEVAETAAVAHAEGLAEFSWAVNATKLNRSKALVQQSGGDLKSKAFEAAVKERYVALGGLLNEDAPATGGKRKGRVVNTADNDED